MNKEQGIQCRAELARDFARQQAAEAKSWEGLADLLYGFGGLCGDLFPTSTDRVQFTKSKAYKEITWLIVDLYKSESASTEDKKPLSSDPVSIIARIPCSLHAALNREAEREGVSLNQLVLTKLLFESLPICDQDKATGEIRVRIPSLLHQRLIVRALEEGVSLNQLILYKIAAQVQESR